DFVDLADDAWLLDGSGAGETYLDVDKILALAKRSGADAIHPGDGNLAEHSGFAQADIEAGLTWIEPPPAAIELLGDKSDAPAFAKTTPLSNHPSAAATHRGSDYLAEHSGVAQAVIEAGLTWIGPPPAATKLLGDKSGARAVAAAVKAPVAPGSNGAVADLAE